MPAIHVRELSDDVLDALKRRAKAHHRSLQGEVLSILEEAAKQAPPSVALEPLRLTMARGSSAGTWRREEIYDDEGR